jgi:hypothetical protein
MENELSEVERDWNNPTPDMLEEDMNRYYDELDQTFHDRHKEENESEHEKILESHVKGKTPERTKKTKFRKSY